MLHVSYVGYASDVPDTQVGDVPDTYMPFDPIAVAPAGANVPPITVRDGTGVLVLATPPRSTNEPFEPAREAVA